MDWKPSKKPQPIAQRIPPARNFEQGMTLAPGESAKLEFDFTEDQILELLYAISQGQEPAMAFSFSDPQGNVQQQLIPFEREMLVLDCQRNKPK